MFDGFKPVFDENSEILILGSFPSVKSREVGFYYGNKQNRFWNVLREIYGEDFADDTDSKIFFLLSHKIALWDMVVRCDVKGSMDADIKNESVADLGDILSNAKIRAIVFNGKKSFELYKENYNFDVKTYPLPSTSPTNTTFDKAKWTAAFNEILNYEHI